MKYPTLKWTCVVVFAMATFARAVEPGHFSKTAIMAAAFRAIGAKNPDLEFRNADYLAGKFLRPEDLASLAAAGNDFRPQLSLVGEALSTYLRSSVAITTNFVRTKHIDETLQQALATGTRQVVVLGAGLDSRGYRFQRQLEGVRFIEVDFPPTQAHKKRLVRAVFGRLPQTVQYLPMDFAKQDLLEQLTKADYNEREKALFIWEGVVPYLPEAAVRGTLRFVAAHSPSGSRIVFDYPFITNHRIHNPQDLFARWGEPFLYGFPLVGPSSVLNEEGLRTVSDLTNAQLVRKYAMRPDGTSSLRLPDADGNRDTDDAGMAIAEVPPKRK